MTYSLFKHYNIFLRLSSIFDISYIIFVEYNGRYNAIPVINGKYDQVLRFFNGLDLPPICGDIAVRHVYR